MQTLPLTLPKRVMLCVDGLEEARKYKDEVGSLVRKLGAGLVLYHASRPELRIYDDRSKPAPADPAIFDAMIADPAFRSIELTVRHARTPFDLVTEILDTAAALNVGWIIMPTHARSGFDRFVYGSITERTIRSCRIPVLTFDIDAKGGAAIKPEGGGFDRIVVPIDFSRVAEEALVYGAKLAKHFQCGLTAVHVVEDYYAAAYPLTDMPVLVDYQPQLVAAARRQLEKTATAVRAETGVSCDVAVEVGAVADAVQAVIAKHARPLVVMATSGRDSIADWILGSRAERMLRGLKGSVLALPKVALTGESEAKA